MPTSAEHPTSSNNEKGSKNKPSNIGACYTVSLPLNINQPDGTNAPLIYAAFSAKCSDDGHAFCCAATVVASSARNRLMIMVNVLDANCFLDLTDNDRHLSHDTGYFP